ncbi:MAG TPA: flagellar biosynthetic protein FliO [Candidatus Paceibacterota bacterium]|nr:flagellar biosynthetic protein FliO [Verrucomicrobiota bacterium]HRY47451.1 flagellar biosynthetic protein FliO [Candidatus Paceibacterota bacterium]
MKHLLRGTGGVFLGCLAGIAGITTGFGAPAAAPIGSSPELPGLAGSVLRLVGALAVILGLFLAAAWYLRQGRGLAWRGRPGQLRVYETRSLGQRQSLLIVGFKQQRFLIGVSPAGIRLVSSLPDAEASEAEPVPPTFGDALRQVLSSKT